MLKADTTTLAAIVDQCFDYSMDGRFSLKQQNVFLTDGKRLRGSLLNLLSARFDDGTQALLDANEQLTKINARLEDSAVVLAHVAQTLNDIATLVGNLDKLLNVATSFL
jgi:hypothetical protein